MKVSSNKSIAFAAGLAWAALAGVAANADDTELFVGDAAAISQARPNILLVLDDSGSMGSLVISQTNYDPSFTYTGTCVTTRVYWSTNGNPPSCGTNNYFNLTALKCRRALDVFAITQGGMYTDNMAQYDSGSQLRWEEIASARKDNPVECEDDRPDPSVGWAGHGDGSSATAVYARNGNNTSRWTSDESLEISWGAIPVNNIYTLFSGNFMNYLYTPGVSATRMQVMQDVAASLVNSINGVNFGLMDFNSNSDSTNGGGIVSYAVENVETGRTGMVNAINALVPGGFTPLSETLHEAHQYLTGSRVIYGSGSVAASRDPTNSAVYDSPIDLECQKTHVVFLTDGEPTRDDQSDAAIVGLTDYNGESFGTLVGATCDTEVYPFGFNPSGGNCLDDLAEYMYEGDMSPLPGEQHITTHTIGFTVDLPVLADAARRGGGQYYTATDAGSLTAALTSIITTVLETQTTFTAPAVSINSFNQTRNLDDLYFSVFRPSGTAHWPGNLKKYKLRADDTTITIVDALGNPAVDPATGFFADTAQSFWSPDADGPNVETGGAANQIGLTRRVYTYLGDPDLTAASNAVDVLNTAIDVTMLNIGVPGDPTRDEIIGFINGLDTADADQDGDLLEARNQMGDPLHAPPVTVVYGPTTDDARIYFATNNGYLHSIDTATGVEQWAFVPEEFLANQVEFFKDNESGTGTKVYGIDGNLRVQMVNVDNDGVIEAGEKVFLFVGMRRGGDSYYALDITNPDNPRVMWRHDSVDLPGVGQSWSSATPARIDIGSSGQNADKSVVVIGGGYDPTQDNYTTSTDTIGNSIYVVDSETGNLLWHGSGNAGADKVFAMAGRSMSYSIPADVRVVDLNGDRLADRMYASDMGGQVWRFDISNGQPAASLVAGSVIAQLGAAGLATPTLADTRRFYYAPDVALASTNAYNYLHIGIGSGYRAHPNETDNHNAFYALRDYKTFAPMTQAEYDALTPIVPANLVDVTTDAAANVPQGSPGWRLDLTGGGGWNGEKVIAETRTFDNRVYVTTYRPGTSGVNCYPALGTNRQYVMSLFTGAPVNNRDGSPDSDPLSVNDRFDEWEGAPPPETIFLVTDGGTNGVVTSGVGTRFDIENLSLLPVRTFWTQESIE
jgi:type IV pilus assembly protein PilY1